MMEITPPSLNEGDRLYLDEAYRLLVQWSDIVHSNGDELVGRASYLVAIAATAERARAILDGERTSPWHDDIPDGYIATMQAIDGGQSR